MTALEAEDVVWDLSDLLGGRDDEPAVHELLDRADILGDDLAAKRGQVASWDAGELASFMAAQVLTLPSAAGGWRPSTTSPLAR